MSNLMPRRGGFLLAGCIAAAAVFATGASAAEPQLLVSQNSRVVAVKIAGLNLDRAYDRQTLEIRIDRAAQVVCDVHAGSRMDRAPAAQACMAGARDGARAQLAALGYDLSPRLAGGGGGGSR